MGSSQFEDDVLYPRAVASSVWTSILSMLWLVSCVLMSLWCHTPFHPLGAIQQFLVLITSPSSWPQVIIFCGGVWWWSIHHSSTFTTVPSVFRSWSSLVHQVFLDPKTFASVLANSLVCGAMAWCFLKLGPAEYSALLATCDPDSRANFCFNEAHIFLVASGMFTGASIGIKYNFFSDNCVNFPIIFKDKPSQIRQKIRPILYDSVTRSLKLMKIFYLVHLLVTLSIRSDPVSRLLYYLDISLFAMTFIITTLLLLVNSTRLSVFNIFACEPMKFSLENHLTALQGGHPLLMLLGLQHLAQLTAQSPDTRRTIFSLSQPGGHPHSWNAISKSCLATISDISNSVSAITAPKAAAPAPVAPPPPAPITSPIRRLAPAVSSSVEDLIPAPSPSTSSNLHTAISQRLQSLKSKPILAAFFQTTSDHAVRTILCRAQSVIWSIDILSNLAAASVGEDKFGVVQKDLPAILTALLSLEHTLMKTRGLVFGVKETHPDLVLRQELRQTVKSGLYRIVIKFGEHILEVPLSKEFRIKIENYQRFLEA